MDNTKKSYTVADHNKVMTFTREEAILFAKQYKIASEGNVETFKFRHQVFYTPYAKYVVEYLTDKFQLK